MKKILSIILCGVLVLGITGCGNKEEKINQQEEQIILNDNKEFEINEELKVLSLINENNRLEILNKDEIIDTSILGKKEVIIKYKNNEEEKQQVININIVDTQKPTIEYKKELTTIKGTKIDLLKDIKVTDNSKEDIKVTIKGKYDINKEGTYDLKYVAKDSSGNETSKDFILVIKSLNLKKGFYIAENNGKYNAITLDGKTITVAYNVGGDELGGHGGYDEYGTYKIKGNKLIATLTHYYNLGSDIDATKLSNSKRLEFTIISDTKLEINNQTLKHKILSSGN